MTETNNGSAIRWNNGTFVTVNASSFTNGSDVAPDGNTYKIITTQGTDTYAAQVCANYNGASSNDWYLPAMCEWIVFGLCNPSFANIHRNLTALGFGGITLNSGYWSSTEFETTPSTNAWLIFFNPDNTVTQSHISKANLQNVRCVRAITY